MNIDLETLKLEHGSHDDREDGMCAMEAVAWLAGEPHSDAPSCTSPVLAAFARYWNDALNDDKRQMLKPYLRRLIGTNTGRVDDEKRAWVATDWLVREYLPVWLELAKLTQDADQIRALPEITSATITATLPTIRAAQKSSDAAWAAASAAAWDAASATLKPTVEKLQLSALALLDRMIEVRS
jgi:hypothetical protein